MTFSLQNITHSYHVATPVLEDVSIHIQKGKVHALLGMNGAGKSTLLKIATGEIQPVVGDIKLILSLFPLLHRAMQKTWHFFRNTRSRSRTYSRIICIRKCTNRSFSNAK